ncbi:MAG: hypothetical protein D0531_02405 [Methylococcales bacterium]|nr:MAG: hypothetical protein D0531_02405 [Methylococcales bacterium]
MPLPNYEAWTQLLQSKKQKHTNWLNGKSYYKSTVVLDKLDKAIKHQSKIDVRFACEDFLLKNEVGSSDYTKYGELVKSIRDMAQSEDHYFADMNNSNFSELEKSAPPPVKKFKWELSSESDLQQYEQPPSYTGVIPFTAFLELQNKWPQEMDESESDWAERIKWNCLMPDNNEWVKSLMPFAGINFKAELLTSSKSKDWGAGAIKRDELMDGMNRIARREIYTGGGKGVTAQKTIYDSDLRIRPLDPNEPMVTTSNPATAPVTRMHEGKIDRENFVLKKLITATNVDTPENGSVFWNGIDCCKLAKRVNEWNRATPGMFGQLEATTDVRHVNGQYVWGGKVEEYFQKTSAGLGHGASGAMTAVVMWGFRDSSILTFAELPAILYGMADALEKGETPRVTSLSIVLIDPLIDPLINPSSTRVKIVNNIDILKCPVWAPITGTQGYAKTECELKGQTLETHITEHGTTNKNRPSIPDSSYPGGDKLRTFLHAAGNTPSAAALKIQAEADKIVYKAY